MSKKLNENGKKTDAIKIKEQMIKIIREWEWEWEMKGHNHWPSHFPALLYLVWFSFLKEFRPREIEASVPI